ncbi:MAG: hypothetical protein U0163_09820 [Gemmatimonadaceae bacterium]
MRIKPRLRSLSRLVVAGAALGALLAACGTDGAGGPAGPEALASCTTSPMLTVPPVDPSQISELTPLGNLNPSGHVFPSDHMYIYTRPLGNGLGTEQVPLRWPGTGVVTNVMQQRFLAPTPHADYTITFFPCADLRVYFAHVATLRPEFAATVGSMDVSCNAPYTTGGITVQQCYKNVTIPVVAGDTFATGGGGDFGAYDRRTAPLAFINQTRIGGDGPYGQLHTVCPLDYFEPNVRVALEAKLGRWGLTQRRTIAPVCGTIMQDVPNTAQGRWFFDATQTEDPHLALVHDNVDPTQAVFSVGTSVPGLSVGTYSFTPSPTAAGHHNVDFGLVTADGAVYCYDTSFPTARRVLVQLVTASRLRIEGASGATCGAGPSWSMSSAAAEYSR